MKEEMVMTTLKRRRPLTPLRIHDQIQKFRSIVKSRKKAKPCSIHGDVERR
jgi:hypothetical protein